MKRDSKVRMTGVALGCGALVLVGVFASNLSSSVHAQGQNPPLDFDGTPGGPRLLEDGQPPAWVHATVEEVERLGHGKSNRSTGQSSTNNQLAYQGGNVETAPKVYLVLWGSQWKSDPSGEAQILQNFYGGVGGSNWLNSVIQYCESSSTSTVSTGTVFCNNAGTPAGNQSSILGGVFQDNTGLAPSHPRQSQLASEAVKAATHFNNKTFGSNLNVQYVIATATRNSSSGFGSSYCAWHSWTNSSYGNIAYTNLPYMTDAGYSCGANFNGLGANAGITIVAGHEMAETITDQFPSSGWVDGTGQEIGDKCAWISSGQGASGPTTFPNGSIFPVQSLWSNAFSGGTGGCVLSYP